MTNLPELSEFKIGNDLIPAVNARDLHRALGVRRDFSSWIKQYTEPKNEEMRDWFKNKDFGVFTVDGENSNSGRPAIDYALSVEMAEHIAMMTRTSKGRQVRDYFRQVRDDRNRLAAQRNMPSVQNPLNQALIDTICRIDRVEVEAKQAKEIALSLYTEAQMQTVREFVYHNNLQRQLPRGQWSAFARHVTACCLDRGIPMREYTIPDQAWQKERAYPASVLLELMPGWVKNMSGQSPMIQEAGVDYA